MPDSILIEENLKAKKVISLINSELKKQVDLLNSVATDSMKVLQEVREMGLSYTDLVDSLKLVQDQIDNVDAVYLHLRRTELEQLLGNPFFARMDLLNKQDSSSEAFYLAKFGLFDQGKPILIDWRTKVASLYYKNKHQRTDVGFEVGGQKHTFDITLKRTFEFDNGEIVKYFNNDIGLNENEIVIDKIKNRTGGVLEDIVETIQENQMEIIEADPREVCIVQGTVGSGKSTVAIHKLSYIFFNYPKIITPARTVVISKSRVLVDYLSSLFPRLGIFDLKYKTVRDILFKYLTENPIKIKFNLGVNTDISEITEEFCINLKQVIYEYKSETIEELKKLISADVSSSVINYNFNISSPINHQIDEILEEIADGVELLRDVNRGIRPSELQHEKNKIAISKHIALRQKIKSERNNLLIRKFKQVLNRFEIDKFLGYKESLIFLYIYYEFFGFSEKELYEYAVIDEAQDMSILETLIVSKLIKNKRICIIGDLNQNIHNNPVSTWEEIFHIFDQQKISTYRLDTNYRSTRNIITYANQILEPFTKNYLPKSIEKYGPEVRENRYLSDKSIKEFIEELVSDYENLDKSVGVIFYNFDEKTKIVDLIKSRISNSEKIIELEELATTVYQPRAIYLTDFAHCKGLEFSKVYLFGFKKEPENFIEAKRFFVGATRAMNELVIFHS